MMALLRELQWWLKQLCARLPNVRLPLILGLYIQMVGVQIVRIFRMVAMDQHSILGLRLMLVMMRYIMQLLLNNAALWGRPGALWKVLSCAMLILVVTSRNVGIVQMDSVLMAIAPRVNI